MALKTAKTNYFRLFICDSLPFLGESVDTKCITDWISNMDDISVATDNAELAKRLKDANGVQFDQIAGIGLQKEPTLIADPVGFIGNRGIPALKIDCQFKVIDPTNTEWTYIQTIPNTRQTVVLVDIQNKLYIAGDKLKLNIKVNQVGNTIEDVEIMGGLPDGGVNGVNFIRYKTEFPHS